jgi:hypothetical protein
MVSSSQPYNIRIHYLAERRAMKKVYRLYGCNKLELGFLIALSGFLEATGKEITSLEVAIKQISANRFEKVRLKKYSFFCVNKQFCGSYEFIRMPGSVCIGIADLGFRILECYEQELISFQSHFRSMRVKQEHQDKTLYRLLSAA